MLGGQMHLRQHREMHFGARARRLRPTLIGVFILLAIGAACFEPLAPTVLAPLGAPVQAVAPPTPLAPLAVEPAPVQPVAQPTVGLRLNITVAPTMVPLPTPLPPLTTGAQDLLSGIKGDVS